MYSPGARMEPHRLKSVLQESVLRRDRPAQHKIIHHVIPHSILERSNGQIIAGRKQLSNIGPSKILILVADRLRHVDVFDARLAAERRKYRASQLIPRARDS